jgi:hypothetical protein
MTKIFINYRTGDEQGAAVLLKQALSGQFGDDEVFLATGMITPGSDFERELLRRVRGSEALLAIVGSGWLSAAHSSGGRALDQSADWVRREIAEAFNCGVRVVPVLIDQAERLTDATLPDDIAALCRCQYLRFRYDDFQYDLDRIVEEVVRCVPSLRRGESGEPADPLAVKMKAQATGHGRVYQAAGDQVINES